MQIDLAPHIEKLLFLHDTLTIPGFGGFSVTRNAAAADFIGGKVAPPAKTLSFNESLTADDGLLIQEIATAHQISVDEARRGVQDAVNELQTALNNREIVTLKGIGRLYKNYVQKIQFLPDTTNFDPEAYGLPPLQFSPIGRSRNVEQPPAEIVTPPPPATTIRPPSAPASGLPVPTPNTPPAANWQPSPTNGGSRVLTILGIILLMLALALGAWYLIRSNTTEKSQVPIKENPATDRTPAEEETDTETGTEESENQNETPSRESNRPVAPAERERPSPAESAKNATETGTRQCILIVATLTEKENVDRLLSKIEQGGYDLYYLEQKGKYQIGIKFPYRNPEEIKERILALQRLTGETDIWIKKQ